MNILAPMFGTEVVQHVQKGQNDSKSSHVFILHYSCFGPKEV
jgi:hypothetical protein